MSDTNTNIPDKKQKTFPTLHFWLSLYEQHDTMLELLDKLNEDHYETSFDEDILRIWMDFSPEEEDRAYRIARGVDENALAEATDQVYGQVYWFLLGLIDDEDEDRWDEVEDL